VGVQQQQSRFSSASVFPLLSRLFLISFLMIAYIDQGSDWAFDLLVLEACILSGVDLISTRSLHLAALRGLHHPRLISNSRALAS
jgi:hypothetical protein